MKLAFKIEGEFVTPNVRVARYFEVFGERFAVHKELLHNRVDDDFYTNDWYRVSHYGSGVRIGDVYEPTVKQAIKVATSYIESAGEEALKNKVKEVQIINP